MTLVSTPLAPPSLWLHPLDYRRLGRVGNDDPRLRTIVHNRGSGKGGWGVPRRSPRGAAASASSGFRLSRQRPLASSAVHPASAVRRGALDPQRSDSATSSANGASTSSTDRA